MIEGSARSGVAAAGQRLHALFRGRCRLGFVFEGERQDAFEATHVDQVEAQRSGTRGRQSLRGVALAEPQEALALAQLGPGEGCIQQAFGELADLRTERRSQADEAVRW